MTATTWERYLAAKAAARARWRTDIEAARQRYSAAVRQAEHEYERDRERSTP